MSRTDDPLFSSPATTDSTGCEATPCRQVLIVGHGRSGTNWLLQTLDLSPLTHCRNEADKLAGSPFRQIQNPWVDVEGADLAPAWDEAVACAAVHWGERDHLVPGPKAHLRGISRRLGLYRLVAGHRCRSVLRLLMPSLRGAEYRFPAWVVNRTALAEARCVLKLNQVPGWAAWLLKHRTNTVVLHIARHPGGMLNSWRHRFLNRKGEDAVRAASRDRLQLIATADEAWADRFGDIDAMGVEDLELWFWRYATETVDTAGANHPRYLRILYEDLVTRTIDIARDIYAHCDLAWSASIESAVHASTVNSSATALAWRSKLNATDHEKVATVLRDPPYCHWWKSHD